MPREKQYATAAERQAAYRERKKLELEESTLPERQVDEPTSHPVTTSPSPTRAIAVLLTLPVDATLTEAEEQLLRDHLGYVESEKRTRLQRAETAERILGHPSLGVSLEGYVEAMAEGAAAFADQIGETDDPYEIAPGVTIENRRKDRIARAERNARWRYQGVLDGEVASL